MLKNYLTHLMALALLSVLQGVTHAAEPQPHALSSVAHRQAAIEASSATSTSMPDDSAGAGVVRRPSPQNAGATIWVMVDGVLEPVVLSEQPEEMALPDSGLPRWLQAALSIFQ